MRPIIFARIANMEYYRGITETDKPFGAGSYVAETGRAHECYNFKPELLDDPDGNEYCLGFVMFGGAVGPAECEMHLEKMSGCEAMRRAETIDGVTVVFCATSPGSHTMRVVGFYKNATAYRRMQWANFSTVENEEDIYEQGYNFIAKKEDCVLIPYTKRHSDSKWYVPQKNKNGSTFGFGRSNIWYASDAKTDSKVKNFVERMIKSIDEYDGENLVEKGAI